MKIYLVQYGCCEDCGRYYYVGYFLTKEKAVEAWEEFKRKEIERENKSIETTNSTPDYYDSLPMYPPQHKKWFIEACEETIKLLESLKGEDYLKEIEVRE